MQFNQGGIPLAGGLLFTYAAGTNTKLATYTDSTGGTPNTNPIVLNANGECDLWLTDGQAYKLVLSPSTDTDPATNAYWIRDNVTNNVFPFNPTFHNVTVSGTLGVTGAATFSSTINHVTLTQPATGATLTLADNSSLITSGAFSVTLTATGTTSVTLPTAGTLARSDQATDTFGALTDVTTNNASITAHGFMKKLPNNAMLFYDGTGNFTAPPSQSLIPDSRSSNTILGGSDSGHLIEITSGTFTQTMTASGTLGNGWYVLYWNNGTGTVTITPNGAETINGAASLLMQTGAAYYISSNASNLKAVPVSFATGYLKVSDQKASGTDGGTSVATTITSTRTFNTVETNTINGASLASDTVTLPPGTYNVYASAPFINSSATKIFLYNTTDSSYSIIGENSYPNSSGSISELFGQITITASKNFKIRYYCLAGSATTGLGAQVGSGQVEVYASAEFIKVS